MTPGLFFKACIIWFLMVLLAIANGAFRDGFLVSQIGARLALPLSGVSLAMLIFAITYITFPLIGEKSDGIYFIIGLQWVLMTLLFELLFGHYAMGKSWSDIIQVFNLAKGDLFILVLVASLFSPYLVAKIKSSL
jgi:hypothetical protein